jgi:hypothetical protein
MINISSNDLIAIFEARKGKNFICLSKKNEIEREELAFLKIKINFVVWKQSISGFTKYLNRILN